MADIIAFCGLNCSQCEGYLATQANDLAAKEAVVEKWKAEYNNPAITVEGITCDGCLAFDGPLSFHCYECDIRQCGIEHKVQNCGECPEYGCAKITRFTGFVKSAGQTLDAIHNARA